jgi:hypothetical protein
VLNAGLGGVQANVLQVVWREAGMFGNPRQHFGPDFLAVVEGEYKIRPAFAGQRLMRAGLPLELPPNADKGGKDTTSLCRWPLAHAAATEILIE